MKAKKEILSLGETYSIESAHTRHVTRLALGIYDGFSAELGLEVSDRDLLFAAASLHDIAYAKDPRNHVVEAARLLQESRIEAYSRDEWQLVIAIVLLHQRDWRSILGHEVFPELSTKALKRAKTLAAMLRIADGLDHGHVQDAGITYCKRGRKVDKIGVHCSWYGNNISWAEGKADLWETVHKRPFRFEGEVEQPTHLFKGVLHKKETGVSAARRILYSQWCIMRDNIPGMKEGRDPECLHDYRVAMRRFRAGLRMFRPFLSDTLAETLNERLKTLSNRVSSSRDAHVAFQLVSGASSNGAINPSIIEQLRGEAEEADRTLNTILESDEWLETVQMINRFLRVELPSLERGQRGMEYAAFASRRVHPLLKRIRRLDVKALHRRSDEDLHRFRKWCRRGRYFSEFAAPVHKEAKSCVKPLKAIAAALGDVRDSRLLAQRFDDPVLSDCMAALEKQCWERFAKGWKKLTGS